MQIGVVGSWEAQLAPEIYQAAEVVGRLVAERGDVLFTGDYLDSRQIQSIQIASDADLAVNLLYLKLSKER